MRFLKKFDLYVILFGGLCLLFAINGVVPDGGHGDIGWASESTPDADGGHGDITWTDGVASIDSEGSGDFSSSDVTSNLITPATITFRVYDPSRMCVEDLFIRQLAASGRICEIVGHQWLINEQTCGVCKRGKR